MSALAVSCLIFKYFFIQSVSCEFLAKIDTDWMKKYWENTTQFPGWRSHKQAIDPFAGSIELPFAHKSPLFSGRFSASKKPSYINFNRKYSHHILWAMAFSNILFSWYISCLLLRVELLLWISCFPCFLCFLCFLCLLCFSDCFLSLNFSIKAGRLVFDSDLKLYFWQKSRKNRIHFT